MSERDVEREEDLKDQLSLKDQLKSLLQQYNIPASELEGDLRGDLGSQPVAGVELPPPTEEMLILGRMHYMLKDNELRDIIFSRYREYIPAYLALSHLLRTSNLDPWDIKPLEYTFYLVVDLCRAGQDRLAMSYVLRMHGFSALKDALDGWRGTLITVHTRTYRIEGERVEKDRRRWWERIFGR